MRSQEASWVVRSGYEYVRGRRRGSMRRMSRWIAVCVLLAVLGFGTAPLLRVGSAVAQTREPILVGEIVSASGAFAVHHHGQHGATLAVEEINAKGGVLGRPLQLITRDDKSSGEEGVKAFRELVGMGVVAVTATPSGPRFWRPPRSRGTCGSRTW